MAEVTYGNNMVVGTLISGSSKGPKVIGLGITVSNGETLSTPLRVINSVGYAVVEATDVDAATSNVYIKSIAGGIITFCTAEQDTYGASTDVVAYLLIYGST